MPSESEPIALHERAADNLQFIRETMARTAAFTAVPGRAGMAMGVVAVVAALVAQRARLQGARVWLLVWLLGLAGGLLLGIVGIIRKARRHQVSLMSGAARKFVLSLFPALLAGAVLTVSFVRWDQAYALPGVWMLLYGAGVTTGGAFSVRLIPLLGSLFMASGALTLFLPAQAGDFMMAVSFGGIHLVFGALVARRYGG
jgi:hypothetical protein